MTTASGNHSSAAHSHFQTSFQPLPDNFNPPALSAYAVESGVILEGWLNKKSHGFLGQWQKRYFVLAESTTCFCVLRVFGKVVETAWGTVPLGLKASVPIHAMESIQSSNAVASHGREFVIKFCPRPPSGSGSGVAGATTTSSNGGNALMSSVSTAASIQSARSHGIAGVSSETGSVTSEIFGHDTKQMTLQAEDGETRLLWVTLLNRALAVALDELS
mmetsp:Transcript_21229/g.35978  ORF Transcript_21229/g.35978 Transcript_21229/m.35978 type:complete len:218 (+) Transcript_21229:3-656(+)